MTRRIPLRGTLLIPAKSLLPFISAVQLLGSAADR